jgi:hypothetical protein
MRTPTTSAVLPPLVVAALATLTSLAGCADAPTAVSRAAEPCLAYRRRGGRAPLDGAVRSGALDHGVRPRHRAADDIPRHWHLSARASWAYHRRHRGNGERGGQLYGQEHVHRRERRPSVRDSQRRIGGHTGRQAHQHRHRNGGRRYGTVRGREGHGRLLRPRAHHGTHNRGGRVHARWQANLLASPPATALGVVPNAAVGSGSVTFQRCDHGRPRPRPRRRADFGGIGGDGCGPGRRAVHEGVRIERTLSAPIHAEVPLRRRRARVAGVPDDA